MNDMAKKPESKNDIIKQMMLFDELNEDITGLFQWPDDTRDRAIRNFAPGETIFCQGEKPEYLFEIISGTLKLSQITENGRQIIFGFPKSDEIIGLTGAKEYRYTAETLTAARLLPVRWKRYYKQLLQNRKAREKLLGWLDMQEEMTQEHISVLALQSPLAKLATFLLKQIEKQVKRSGSDSPVIHLPMTQRDIAAYLAIAPETCSRAMKKLREDGILQAKNHNCDRHLLKIQNHQRLIEIADGPNH